MGSRGFQFSWLIPNFSFLLCLEVPSKFLVDGGSGVVDDQAQAE